MAYRNYIRIVSDDLKNRLEMRKRNGTNRFDHIKMESEFVLIQNVPIRVDSWGGFMPSKILNKMQDKPEELILMFPGNPGVTKFYERFLYYLYEKTKKPIWIVSHGGHDKMCHSKKKLPSLKKNEHLYNLQGQVDQKDRFIRTYLEGVKIYCIGHSIGSKMAIELLKEERKIANIDKCILLFPTIERMAETPNGKIVVFVINYILTLALLGSWIFVYLPQFLQVLLVRTYCYITSIHPSNVPAIINLIDPHVLNQVFFLADDEMKTVRELDDDVLKTQGHKLTLYYGATDGWTPVEYCRGVKEKYKNINVQLCSKGYKHAFVLNHSSQIADLVNSWLKG